MLERNKLIAMWQCILLSVIYTFGAFFSSVTYLDWKNLAILFGVIAAIGIVLEGRMQIDFAMFFLLEATLFMSVYEYTLQQYYESFWGMILFFAYLLGKLSVGSSLELKTRNTVIAYFVLAGGIFTTGIVDLLYSNYVIDYFNTESIMSLLRQETIGRCVSELFGLLMVCGLGYMVIEVRKKNVLALVGIILTLYYLKEMIRHEGRYLLFMIILIIPICVVIYFYDKWPSLSSSIKKAGYILAGFLVGFVVLFMLAFNLNVLGIKDLYLNSYLSGSGGIIHNVRFQLAYKALTRIPTHLRGGYGYGLKFGPHNSWLEYGDKYGALVFVVLECFRIVLLIRMINFSLRRNEDNSLKYLLIPSFLFMNVYFSMEPIGFRTKIYFVFMMIFMGIVSRTCELEEQSKWENSYLKLEKDVSNLIR